MAHSTNTGINFLSVLLGLWMFGGAVLLSVLLSRRTVAVGYDWFFWAAGFLILLAFALALLCCSALLNLLFRVDVVIEDGRARVVISGLRRRDVLEGQCVRASIVINDRYKSRGVQVDVQGPQYGLRLHVSLDGIDGNNGELAQRLSRLTGSPTYINFVGVGSVRGDC